MKKSILLFFMISLFSFPLKGSEKKIKAIELGLSISSHLFLLSKTKISSHFKRKLTSSGSLVYNPIIRLSQVKIEKEYYQKHTLLFFMDCLNLPSFGYAYSLGKKLEGGHQFGFALGGYLLDRKEWDRIVSREEAHYFVVSESLGITPILGIELNLKLFKIGEKFEFNFKNYFSFIFTSHTFTLDYLF